MTVSFLPIEVTFLSTNKTLLLLYKASQRPVEVKIQRKVNRCFVLPQLTSYGGVLRYVISFAASSEGQSISAPDVILLVGLFI